jgi:hypothetical protein
MRRQVAGEEDEIDVRVELGERLLEMGAARIRCVDIPRCRDPNPLHGDILPKRRSSTLASGQPGTLTEFDEICESMKKGAAALRDADIPFMLGGGLAAWARGGPSSDHDVDFLVKPEDADRAIRALADAGMRTEKPPEGWLLKAYDGDTLIDVIFDPATGPVTDEVIERADDLEVLSTQMKVMALEDIMATKLLALNETHLDLKGSLEMARAVREQVDWDEVRERTRGSPYAKAFFALVEELGVVERAPVG